MTRTNLIAAFELLERRREPLTTEFASIHPDQLWVRPEPSKWSAGETMIHLIRTVELLKGAFAWVRPLLLASAWFGRREIYPTEMESYYGKLKKPLSAPSVVAPQNRHPLNGRTMAELVAELRRQTDQLAALTASIDDATAGNMRILYPFPSPGFINLFQLIFTLGNHEVHHFGLMRAALARLSVPAGT